MSEFHFLVKIHPNFTCQLPRKGCREPKAVAKYNIEIERRVDTVSHEINHDVVEEFSFFYTVVDKLFLCQFC